MWLFAAWVGLVGGIGLLHDAPLYASGFLVLGLAGLTKTLLGAGRFLGTVPAIIAREREARAAQQRVRPRPAPARPIRRAPSNPTVRIDAPVARRAADRRRSDQQRAAA